MTDAARRPPHVDVSLPGGRPVRLRLATHEDAGALSAGFLHLSEDSRYTRFFTAVPHLDGAILDSLVDLDQTSRIAIAAFDPTRPSEVTDDLLDGFGIGVARYIQPDPGGPAELAVAIIDEYQGIGLGLVLLSALIVVARHHCVPRLDAVVLSSNQPMIRLLHRYAAIDLAVDPPDPGIRTLAIDVTVAVHEVAGVAAWGPALDGLLRDDVP